jgi:hypothetical protein
MARFEIMVEVNGIKSYIDTYKEEPISLTYNIADIMDIGARNSSFSKTIKVPETSNNRKLFGDISNLSVDASFNPNKKSKAYIMVDTIVVLEGYLQLRKAYVDRDANKAEYEVVIYADNDNFFKEIGDNYLTDLNVSELDHMWDKTTIEASWTYDWTKGFYYPLIDYGSNWELGSINTKVADLKPSMNVKYLLDKIFRAAGYRYESKFLNDKLFKNLYIPFAKSNITRSNTGSKYRFSVGNATAQVATTPTSSGTTGGLAPITILPITVPQGAACHNVPGGQGGPIQVCNALVVDVMLAQINNGSAFPIYMRFTDEALPNGDPDNLFTPIQDGGLSGMMMRGWYFTAPANPVGQRFKVDFDMTFRIKPVVGKTTISFRRWTNPITGSTEPGGYAIPINGSKTPLVFNSTAIPGLTVDSTGKRFTGTIQSDMLNALTGDYKKLNPGEVVWVAIEYCATNKDIRSTIGNSNLETSAATPAITIDGTTYNRLIKRGEPLITFNPGTRIYNELDTIVNSNEFVEMSATLPEKFKQKDFITSIIKMFNLYVEPSKDYPKTLLIEPRDEYYKSGRTKNWTKKLDKNVAIEEQILGETQNRQTTFKYKDDSDYYNTTYKSSVEQTYGQYDFLLDNDFISGKKVIETSFAPTPLVKLKKSVKFPIPVIAKQSGTGFTKTDSIPRILTRYYSSNTKTWVYSDYQVRPTSNNIYLTTVGFTNVPHPNYQVGDYIQIVQSDGGALKPKLTGKFRITEIYDTKTIGIDLAWWEVGSGAAVAGTCTPLDGLLPQYVSGDVWKFEGVEKKAIPYLGHLDNPYNPKYDINFGQNKGTFDFLSERITNDNLYKVYWQNYMNEISDKDSRIITASFYLTADDIADFRFNDNIFIDEQYYKVNKIINYNPAVDSTVKIELIKTKYITIVNTQNKTNPNLPWEPWVDAKPWSGRDRPWLWEKENLTNWSMSATNDYAFARNSSIWGYDNYASGRSLAIFGNDNRVAMASSIGIYGDNNRVEAMAASTLVVGNNNRVAPAVERSMVIGSNARVAQSDTLVITSKIAIAPNYIDAARNEILNPFFDSKPINYVSGSRNEIRNLGSYDTISYVSASRESPVADSWSGQINNA